jgi:hypothetical protein
MPVAAFESAAFQVIDGLTQDKRAGDEFAADKGLAADVDGLVLERLAFVLGQKHAYSSLQMVNCKNLSPAPDTRASGIAC